MIEGIQNMQRCVYRTRRTCDKCKLKMIDIEYQDIVFVDVQPMKNDISILEPISSLPMEIRLKNDLFYLKSIIEYSKGHYKVHCLRNDKTWYCFDDLFNTVFISERTRHISPHVLIYIRLQK